MKRFTAKMIEKNMTGKGLHACIAYLNGLGITQYTVYRNSKGHPAELYFKFAGTDFGGYATSVIFNKNTGLCLG